MTSGTLPGAAGIQPRRCKRDQLTAARLRRVVRLHDQGLILARLAPSAAPDYAIEPLRPFVTSGAAPTMLFRLSKVGPL